MTEDDLLKLKKKVETAKNTVSELKGQKTALMNQLKTDWGCSTIEAGEKKLKGLIKEVETLSQQIDENIEELQTKYGWSLATYLQKVIQPLLLHYKNPYLH